MLKAKFGIEVEFTGITRTKAAEIMANHFESSFTSDGGFYDKKTVVDSIGRKWTVMKRIYTITKGWVNMTKKRINL